MQFNYFLHRAFILFIGALLLRNCYCSSSIITTVILQKTVSVMRKKKKYSKLKLQRVMKDMLQRDLAEKSGVNFHTIQALEAQIRDINKLSVASVIQLAIALDVDVLSFVDLEDIVMPDGKTAEEYLRKQTDK